MQLWAVIRPSKSWDKIIGATWPNQNFPDLLMWCLWITYPTLMNSEVFVHVVVRSHEFRPAGNLALQQGDYSNNSHADMSEPGIPSREQYQLEGVGSRIPTLSPLWCLLATETMKKTYVTCRPLFDAFVTLFWLHSNLKFNWWPTSIYTSTLMTAFLSSSLSYFFSEPWQCLNFSKTANLNGQIFWLVTGHTLTGNDKNSSSGIIL